MVSKISKSLGRNKPCLTESSYPKSTYLHVQFNNFCKIRSLYWQYINCLLWCSSTGRSINLQSNKLDKRSAETLNWVSKLSSVAEKNLRWTDGTELGEEQLQTPVRIVAVSARVWRWLDGSPAVRQSQTDTMARRAGRQAGSLFSRMEWVWSVAAPFRSLHLVLWLLCSP